MITRDKIDSFYKDVDDLKLKFPVAAISKATGESKGNVSRYLNKRDEPSEAFLKKFYDSFGIVPREITPTPKTPYNDQSPDYIIGKLNGLLAGEQARRNDAERFYDKLLEKLGSNLNDLLGGQQVLYAFVRVALEYEAAIASQGDKTREKELLGSLNKRLEDVMKMASKEGNVAPLRT